MNGQHTSALASRRAASDPMPLKALIFDFDGTIADTEETHRQAFNHAFVRFGVGWEWTQPLYRELLRVSGGRERIAHFVSTSQRSAADKARLLRLVPALHQAKTELYLQLVADGRCRLRPGVARLLDEAARAGLQLAIASTSSEASVGALLGCIDGLAGVRFSAIACAEHVRDKKPAADVYRLALSMLGRAGDECAAIEDSRNGMLAAQRADLFTVVTPSQWTAEDDFTGADLLLPHLGDGDRPLHGVAAEQAGGPWLRLASLRTIHAEHQSRLRRAG